MAAVGPIKVTMGLAAGINEPVLAGEGRVDHGPDQMECHYGNWPCLCLSQWRLAAPLAHFVDYAAF